MGPFIRDMLLQHPVTLCAAFSLCAGLAATLGCGLDVCCSIGAAALLTCHSLVPAVFMWAQSLGISRIWDMQPGNQLRAWRPTSPSPHPANMWVATSRDPQHVVGVLGILAGSATVAMPALKSLAQRSAAGHTHLHPPPVLRAAERAQLGKGGNCTVFRVSVAPQARGRGVGRLLMATAERWALQQGFTAVQLTTASPTAIAFYLSLGYRIHKQKVRLFDFQVVHMTKSLVGM